jgi:hypothetical protein
VLVRASSTGTGRARPSTNGGEAVMGFRECWVDPKSGREIDRSEYERRPPWYQTFQHRIYLLCDLHRRTDGSRHACVGPRNCEKHEPLTKEEIRVWLRENAPTWEMQLDPRVPLHERECACVPAYQQPAPAGRWKPLRDVTEEDL